MNCIAIKRIKFLTHELFYMLTFLIELPSGVERWFECRCSSGSYTKEMAKRYLWQMMSEKVKDAVFEVMKEGKFNDHDPME